MTSVENLTAMFTALLPVLQGGNGSVSSLSAAAPAN